MTRRELTMVDANCGEYVKKLSIPSVTIAESNAPTASTTRSVSDRRPRCANFSRMACAKAAASSSVFPCFSNASNSSTVWPEYPSCQSRSIGESPLSADAPAGFVCLVKSRGLGAAVRFASLPRPRNTLATVADLQYPYALHSAVDGIDEQKVRSPNGPKIRIQPLEPFASPRCGVL